MGSKRKAKKVDKRRQNAALRRKQAAQRRKDAASARAESAKRRKRRRTGRRTLHHILLVVFFLSAGIILSLTVFFKIDGVAVTGCDKYPAAEIIEASGILAGDNLFRVPAAQIEDKLKAEFPYIENARVRRVFPPSIEIEIEQSKPALAVPSADGHVVISRDGKVLERGSVLLTDDVLLVKGVDLTGRKPGDRLGEWESEPKASRVETDEERIARSARNKASEERAGQEKEALRMVDRLLSAMEETGFSRITNVDLTNRLNMVVMYENRLTIKLGSEGDLPSKLLFLDTAINEKLHPEARGTINAADYTSKSWLVYTPDSGYNIDGSPIASYNPEEDTAGAN